MKARAIISDTRRRKRTPAASIFTNTLKGMALGGNPHMNHPKPDDLLADRRRAAQLADYAAIDAKVVRFNLNWDGIEPVQGQINWSYHDKIINDIVAAGLIPLPLFHGCPGWARASLTDGFGVTRQASYPADMALFAQHCVQAVNRYKDRVKCWEMWNEPNLGGFWLNPNINLYVDMIKAIYPAVKAADPTAVYMTAGLAAVPDDDIRPITAGHPYPEWKSAVKFIGDMYARIAATGGGTYFDAIAFHPYSWPLAVADTAPWNGWNMMHINNPSIRSHMVANGDTAKTIWITEFGGPTGTGSGAVSDAGLSAMVADSHTRWVTYPWAGPFVWYEYWDGPRTDLTDTEMNFGILRNNWAPKPAYNTYLKITHPAQNAFGRSFQQGVSSYTGCVDTRLNQAAPSTAHNAETTLITSGHTTSSKSQVLIRFDNIIGAGGTQIPTGARIIAAEMQIWWDGVGGHPVTLHRMLVPWTASSTWNTMTGGVTVNSAEAADPSWTIYWMDNGATPAWLRFEVTADVQAFVNGTATNNGWLLEPTKESPITMASSENATVANRPVLYVSYAV